MRQKVIYSIGLCLLSAAFAILAIYADAQIVPRVSISIYKYSVNSTKQAKGFDQFKDIISAKIRKLSEELQVKSGKIDYISGLSPHFVTRPNNIEHLRFDGSVEDLYKHWRNSSALEVFTGRVRDVGSGLSVRSDVFLGDLKGDLAKQTITLDLPINDDQFDTTRDSHTAVTLYALAMDAQRCGSPPDVVLVFLSEAYSRVNDVRENVPDIKILKEAIEKAIGKLR